MTNDANTNVGATAGNAPDNAALVKAELGKPASSGKILAAKITGLTSMFISGASVAFGVAAIVMGRKAETKDMRMLAQGLGGALTVGGLVGGITGKGVWDTANSADRTRHYLNVAEKLNSKEHGQAR